MRAFLFALAVVPTVVGCTPAPPPEPDAAPALAWRAIDSLNARLPAAVRVFEGAGDTLRAWYVRIDEADPAVTTRVVVATDSADLRDRPSDVAERLGACVVANGGYFTMEPPTEAVGLVVAGGALVAPATGHLVREDLRYPVARAALGLTDAGAVELAWATARDAAVCAHDAPLANRPGAPAEAPASCTPWPVRDALGAGPMLLRDGAFRVTADAEVFFGTSIPGQRHPRTAAGRTADGALVLMVVDGRQAASRGVTLVELARLMRGVGAVDALNLDGGGSSALVVAGVRLNRPTGYDVERDVHTLLATTCE